MSRSSLTRFLSGPFIFFTIIMMIKSSLAWIVIFDDIPIWKPLLTELPLIWIGFCLIEWFAAKRRMWIYLAMNLLLSGIFFAAIMYYKYYGVIVNYHALAQVNQVTSVKSSMFSLLDPYYLFIFADVLITGGILVRRRIKLGSTERPNRIPLERRARRRVASVILILSMILCMLNIYPNRASMSELTQAEQMGILGYEAYTILDRPDELVPIAHIDQAAIHQLKQTTQLPAIVEQGAASGRNVIMLQLESFQNFLIGLEVDGQEITPNLNELARQNLYFPNFYQQVGQGNTSDAEFVVNTSFYTPPNGAATTVYADKALPSLPKLMAANGYQTATFHTNDVRFWNRDQLYKALGFDQYYDIDYFGTQDSIAFSASDEVLYSKTLDKLESMQSSGNPFYAHIISMSAHHPYTLPENKVKLTLPERYKDTLPGDYLIAQHYADQAVGQLIAGLKERGLWGNSLLVLYGDHLGLPIYSLDREDKVVMKELYGRDYTSADMINIPLIISAPGVTPSVQLEQIGGQVDILPTIAGLTGVSLEDQLHFGQDLLREGGNLLPERYYLPSGSVLNDASLFIPAKGYGDGTHYSLADAGRQDAGQQQMDVPSEENPQISADNVPPAIVTSNNSEVSSSRFITKEQYDRALDLAHLSNSYLSQLPDRMATQ
ncbi:LTA synthase family protein [Paenibacillus sp. 1781tsa1]|uniref:LTA synthase family protein n=1 Tax=Paenibacillus sp. 1781tsa1 TaxID=2953810 RepID=UPI00209FF8B4|nr:LTA synthase family protein [Paenibacillus sp. 1781tsa1]MCP1187172.1 LTA synthase family protein [Paenibacillus sp. 1781tsa1]